MKKLYLILSLTLILCFMIGCQDKAAMAELEEFRAQTKVEEQNKKIVLLAWEKMWSEGKLDVADEIFAPDHTMNIRGKSNPWGPETAKKVVSSWLKSFPDNKIKVEDIIAEGDKVAVRVTFTGTHQGKLGDTAPTGNKIEFTEMIFTRFENGKVVEEWGAWDSVGMYLQLGKELNPKEKK